MENRRRCRQPGSQTRGHTSKTGQQARGHDHHSGDGAHAPELTSKGKTVERTENDYRLTINKKRPGERREPADPVLWASLWRKAGWLQQDPYLVQRLLTRPKGHNGPGPQRFRARYPSSRKTRPLKNSSGAAITLSEPPKTGRSNGARSRQTGLRWAMEESESESEWQRCGGGRRRVTHRHPGQAPVQVGGASPRHEWPDGQADTTT